jgi:F-type H+-transporting ATPase subunit delta
LSQVDTALKRDAALRAAMAEPGQSVQEKLQRLGQAVPGGAAADVRQFLGTLLEAGQLEQLPAVLAEFERLVRRRPERKIAHVTSAVPLTPGERGELQARLADRFGADLEFQFEVDESIIGGIRLRVGDRVIDGSVAGKLAALRDHLAA